MRWTIAAVLAAMLLAAPALADTVRPVPLGCGQMSAFSSATALSNIPNGATFIMGSVETNSVRMRDDGPAPTASVGVLYGVGNFFMVDTLVNVQFIPTTGSATVNYCAYR